MSEVLIVGRTISSSLRYKVFVAKKEEMMALKSMPLAVNGPSTDLLMVGWTLESCLRCKLCVAKKEDMMSAKSMLLLAIIGALISVTVTVAVAVTEVVMEAVGWGRAFAPKARAAHMRPVVICIVLK